MTPKTIYLHLRSNKVYLTVIDSIPWSSVTGVNVAKESLADFLWKCEYMGFNQYSGVLKLKVIDYDSGDMDAFNRQGDEPYLNPDRIMIEKFSGYSVPKKPRNRRDIYASRKKEEKIEAEPPKSHLKPVPDLPIDKQYTITVPLIDVELKNGKGVVAIGWRMIPEFRQTQLIELPNKFLREEYNPIKEYIVRILGIKEISIHIQFRYSKSKGVSQVQADSEDFLQVNSNIIETAFLRFAVDSVSHEKIDLPHREAVVVSVREIIRNHISDQDQIDLETEDLLQTLLDEKEEIHDEELRYLARQQSLSEDVRLVLVVQPHVGFLFWIQNSSYNHFILETYKVNLATYIWSFYRRVNSERPKVLLELVEDELGLINEVKRNRYKARARRDSRFGFKAIEHDNDAGGFINWKDRVEGIIGGI